MYNTVMYPNTWYTILHIDPITTKIDFEIKCKIEYQVRVLS